MLHTVLLATAGIAICVASPPLLKDPPPEVLFKVTLDPEPALLRCEYLGPPEEITITWLRDGKPFDRTDILISEDGSHLIFRYPQPEHEGNYRCFAKTPYGVASTPNISFRQAYINASSPKTERIKPILGRPLRLDCPSPDAYPKPSINWVRKLPEDPTISNSILDQRITIGPDGGLYFSNVTKKDVSTRFSYACLAETPFDKSVLIAEYFIEDVVEDKEPKTSEILPQYLNEDVTLFSGDRVFIYCIYGGTPLPYPDWFKDGVNVNNSPGDRVTRYNRSGGKRLLISEVLPEDAGSYRCRADNEVGVPKEHNFTVKVESRPIFIVKPPQQQRAQEGLNITIPCEIKSNHAVLYTYNATPLNATERIKFSNTDIVINYVKKSDAGYYGCGDGLTLYGETLVVID